ncbi:MAG: cupin domain-containing protein [Vicinamibacterales bacterium]
MDRREMLQAGLAALAGAVAVGESAVAAGDRAAPAGAGWQAKPPATQSKALGAHPLGPAFEGWQGTILEVTYPPGMVGASHQHPGPTFGYVVRGRIRWAINGQPEKILGPGESFFEPMGSVHSTSANASDTEPATIAVVILGRTGEALSKPATPPVK